MFLLAFNNTTNDIANDLISNDNNNTSYKRHWYRKYFLWRVDVNNYNVLID